MDDEPDTAELKAQQLDHVAYERRAADHAEEPAEVAAHQRRAEKADYLRRKLEERERSEQENG